MLHSHAYGWIRIAAVIPAALTSAFVMMADIARAQTPTKAQQDALRSNCRSDFMRNCSGVSPGGREALGCLMRNKTTVSAACQGALNAIAASAAPKTAPKPVSESKPAPEFKPAPESKPAAEPKPESRATAPAPIPVAPQPAARKPAGIEAAPAASAPVKSAPVKAVAPKAVPPARAAATPARPATPVAPTAAPAAIPAPPVTHQPRLGEARLIRRFCGMDFRVLCKGVALGQGRAIRCLADNAAALSPACRQALAQTAR